MYMPTGGFHLDNAIMTTTFSKAREKRKIQFQQNQQVQRVLPNVFSSKRMTKDEGKEEELMTWINIDENEQCLTRLAAPNGKVRWTRVAKSAVLSVDIFINQDEKRSWFDCDLRLSPYLFFLCWLAHIEVEVWKMVLLSFDSLEKQSNVKRKKPLLQTLERHTYARVSIDTVNLFDVQTSRTKGKRPNVCRHQPLELMAKYNEEHLVDKSKRRYLLFFFVSVIICLGSKRGEQIHLQSGCSSTTSLAFALNLIVLRRVNR